LTDFGGEITVLINGPKSGFSALSKNGINAQKSGQAERTFRVIGNKKNTCNFFREIYDPTNIFANWQK